MIRLSRQLVDQYLAHLSNRGVATVDFAEHRKWLNYYLDYCEKYSICGSEHERLQYFIQKLKEKNQTAEQRRRAAHAVSFYFEMRRTRLSATPSTRENIDDVTHANNTQAVVESRLPQYC